MPESTRNGLSVEFVHNNAEAFLPREENEGDMTGNNNHEGDLHDVSLPEFVLTWNSNIWVTISCIF